MEVAVKLFGGLQHGIIKGSCVVVRMRESAVVSDLLGELFLEQHDVEIITVNGFPSQFDTPLHDGDKVSLLPFMGGG